MFQINPANSSSENLDLSGLLKILHVLIQARKKFTQSENAYQYNYNYLNPLAITNVEQLKIPFIPIAIPLLSKDERPSLQWVTSVIASITILLLNQLSVNDKVDALREIGDNLQNHKSPEELNEIVLKLESTLKEIGNDLKVDEKIQASRQLKAAQFHRIMSSIEADFQAIDNLMTQYSAKMTEPLLPVEKSTISRLQKVIQNAAKLAELADNKAANLKLSPDSIDLDDYDKLFRVIRKPKISNTFQQDEIFAYLQVAGPNPVVLQQFKGKDSRLPVTESQYEAIAQKFNVSDSLTEALGEGRLYVADYTLLEGLVNGSYISQNLQQQKYISAPVALFAVPQVDSPSRSLFPVAISYQQTTVSNDWIMFNPLDVDREGEPWMTAKNVVAMADCTYHEIISHLGRTHLVVEAFIVPTNHLPDNHPLKNLLKPHFEGTVLINYGAHALLVAPGGSVDSLLPSSIGGDQSLTAKATQSYLFNFNEVSFPQTLVSRGVTDSSKLPVYPYRDDGLLIWDAIESWVNDYFSIYYSNDSSVLEDSDLQTWASTLVSLEGGRLQNFGDDGKGQIQTRDYLVKVVSTLIFTASAQHAAVNFPQKELMMYAPAFPLARYLPAPKNIQESESFIKGLPSLSQAQNQLNVLFLLGAVYYTQLGQYSESAFPADSNLLDALNQFQTKLKAVEATIKQRNQSPERLIPYEFLLPSKIPQSINI